MLMTNLRTRYKTTINKLNHQLTHLVDVVDLLLQDDMEGALDLINDRMHFLLRCETHSLDDAVSFYKTLSAETRTKITNSRTLRSPPP